MTNNFTPKKSGTAARPQLSPEEYAAKKMAHGKAFAAQVVGGALHTVAIVEEHHGTASLEGAKEKGEGGELVFYLAAHLMDGDAVGHLLTGVETIDTHCLIEMNKRGYLVGIGG